jgi:N-acetylglucosamine malate deacetylase 1
VIAPHPDDEVIGMGGVMAQMVRNGCDVGVISLTFGGDKESEDEARNAANVLGYTFTHFFEFKPKHIPVDLNTLKNFAQIINDKKPDIIFLPFILDDHDDHRRANELLLAAHENGLLNKVAEKTEIWAYQVYTALPLNCVVNITDVIDRKSEAISCYVSRFKQRDWAHYAKGLSAFNVRFLEGSKNQDYAEVFFRADISAYLKMCSVYFRNSAGRCYDIEGYNSQQ